MRAQVALSLLTVGLALSGCAGSSKATDPVPSTSPTTVSQTPPTTTTAAAFEFPKRSNDELARSEYRQGTVTGSFWHKVTRTQRFAAESACHDTSSRFAYTVSEDGQELMRGTFSCAVTTRNEFGELKKGAKVTVTLTEVAAPGEAWVIIVPAS